MRVKLFFLLFIVGVNFTPVFADSKGMAVEPGEMILSQIVPGTNYNLAQRKNLYLTIFNESDKDCSFILTTAMPSTYGLKPKKGYADVPDPSWISLKKKELSITANSSQKVEMELLIPDKADNYEKKWCVIVAITAIPANKDTIGLRLTPAYYLETITKAGA